MKLDKTVLFFCLTLVCFRGVRAGDDVRPLVFSLGSNCEIASVLGHFNLRHAAGPVDWLLTLNYPAFLLLLENDFEGMVDERYLTQYPENYVINSLYSIELRHDWPDLNFQQHLPEVQEKF